jgi:cytochrome c-type biogenesis protein CcsB
MKAILVFLSLIFAVSGSFASVDALKKLPIQDAGRTKPLDTFAKESLQLIYGKESYEGRPAYEIILTWLLDPSSWEKKEIIEIKYHLVKQGLKLPEEKKYYSPREIWTNERLTTLLQDLQSQREAKVKLDPYYQALQRLENQLFVFKEIATGKMLRLAPPKEGTGWRALAEFDDSEKQAFLEVTQAFVAYLGAVTDGGASSVSEAKSQVEKKTLAFQEIARASNPDKYPSLKSIEVEVLYNDSHPFRWAWICYALGAVIMGLCWVLNKSSLYKVGWTFAIIGLVLHISGMVFRVYLMGRPPVTNMYETVVWVGFGAVVFSMVMEAVYRWRFILLAGSFVGVFCLVLANMAPVVLDQSLQPLEPVLRSNFWLTIHVMTITISYAAFFLAFSLGDLALLYYLRDEKKYANDLKAITLAIYRAKQIGVGFLTPGIILGGVWADYSWGRFWGWDPKETWALIVLLGYIAVLHGRLVGWIKDFGMAVSAVITFSLVIMAWYGVNFVLGAGLHSYGFGAGGVEYVATFVALHVVYVVFVSVVRRNRLKPQ